MHRSELAVPGQIMSDRGAVDAITISQLSEDCCRLREEIAEMDPDKPLELWLGALGPLRAKVSPQSRTILEFDGAIHPAIVKHFNG